MEEKLYAELVKWLDGDQDKEITVVHQEDEGTWHNRIFLVIYTEKDVLNVNLIRVFTGNEINIALSVDYQNEFSLKPLSKDISTVITDVLSIYKRVI